MTVRPNNINKIDGWGDFMKAVMYLRSLFLLGIMLISCDSLAGVFNVNNNTDVDDINPGDGICETAAGNGVCTIRAAIGEANALSGADIVNLPSGTYTLASQLMVSDDVVINGAAKTTSIIDANQTGRVLTVSNVRNFKLSNVTLTNGKLLSDYGGCIKVSNSEHASFDNIVATTCSADSGASFYTYGVVKTSITNSTIENNSGVYGVIYVETGLVEIDNSTIRQNTATYGAAIYQANGNISLSNTTINNNHAENGGAIYIQNATGNPYHLAIINSTLSGNRADISGGAINAEGRVEIKSLNSTITNNIADFNGGGVAGTSETRFLIRNTILAGNFSNSGQGPDCNLTGAWYQSYGNNIIGNNTDCAKNSWVTDQVGTSANPINPMLAQLANNGGPTQTHALIVGSPAIDAGDFASCQSMDQRGVQRSLDGTNDGIANCDIGAFEYQGTVADPPKFAEFTVNTEVDAIDANLGDGVCETETGNGICSLRAAIMESNILPGKETIYIPNGTYTLSLTAKDPLQGGTLIIFDSINLVGAGKRKTIINANELYIPFNIGGLASVSDITNLSIVNGKTVSDVPNIKIGCGGLIIDSHANVTLRNSNIANNTADMDAGICNYGNLNLDGVSVLDNTSLSGDGGGIYNLGVLNINKSLIANNQVFNDSNLGSGGGILNQGELYITNTTLSGNTVQGKGGAIYSPVGDNVTVYPVYLSNVTITKNYSTVSGGGIGSSASTASLSRYFIANSIIADNSGGNCAVTVTSLGYNLEDSNSCLFNSGEDTTSFINTNAQLDFLADNGGETLTHAPLNTSPAVDAGNPDGCRDHAGNLILEDQRGDQRPAVGTSGIARCDIGAFEQNTIMANAGADQLVAIASKVVLDGSQSFSPNGISSYSWAQVPTSTITLTDSTTATPEFNAPASSSVLTFELTATDSVGNSSVDTVVITVNAAPNADAGSDQIVNGTDTVNLNGSASHDSDGEIVIYSWSQTGGGAVSLTAANTATPNFTAPVSGSLSFELTVTDNHGFTDKDSITVTINTPPIADAGQDQTVVTGATVNLSAAASSDSDGTISSYTWTQISGTSVTINGSDTSTANFTAPASTGTLVFSLAVTDNYGATDTASKQVIVST